MTLDLFTGHTDIDEDHSRILVALDKLQDPGILTDLNKRLQLIEEFVNYASNHFTREEDLMRELRYPDALDHRNSHRDLQIQLIELLKPICKGVPLQSADVQELRNNFFNHVQEFDILLVQFIQKYEQHVSKRRV